MEYCSDTSNPKMMADIAGNIVLKQVRDVNVYWFSCDQEEDAATVLRVVAKFAQINSHYQDGKLPESILLRTRTGVEALPLPTIDSMDFSFTEKNILSRLMCGMGFESQLANDGKDYFMICFMPAAKVINFLHRQSVDDARLSDFGVVPVYAAELPLQPSNIHYVVNNYYYLIGSIVLINGIRGE